MALESHFQQDINLIQSIPIVSTLLDVIAKTTGMGFVAVARVTHDRWITCSSYDTLQFGLKPGDELKIETTICNEIRGSGKAVYIDHVSDDPDFKDHHTPAMYGFESYISVPIIKKDGSWFGTLCAIDPNPHEVTAPAVIGMFDLFSDLISFHLQAAEEVELSRKDLFKQRGFIEELELQLKQHTLELEEKNAALENANIELQSFTYISSHDLQEPLRKIQTFSSMLLEKEIANLSAEGRNHFLRIQNAAARMQVLINDLLTYSRASVDERKFEPVNINDLIAIVHEDLKEEFLEKRAVLEAESIGEEYIIPFQFRQLMYNLLGNSLKFSHGQREPHIRITSEKGRGELFGHNGLLADSVYIKISLSDNGIGFDDQYNERIFDLFQRLHGKTAYNGTGIGLAIVKKIMDNHNGLVLATGIPDEGARFDMYFPVRN